MEKVYQISCPSCGYRMQVEQENLGRTGTCPKCSHSFQVSSCTVDTVLDSDDPENSRRKQVDVAGIPVDWEVGNVFLDLYAVTDLLGEGGMGKVFKVRHLGWDIDLAVKCPKPQLLTNARAMEAFQQECETWVNLGLHPHTTSCYYVRKLGGFPRIFAEYVEGGSLRRWITRGKLYHGGHDAALERIMTVAIQVAWGLHHAHENNLVHRDVKSANVLLSRSGSAKVTDFGLASARLRVATLAAAGTQNRLASAGGRTPAYCSPEQARNEQVSQKTDIYSWAVCLLEMLCGGVTWKTGPQAPEALRRLMRNGPRRKRVPPTPPELARVITWCLSAELGDRPDDMLEVVRELRAIYRLSTGKPFEQEDPRSVAGRAESLNNRAVSLLDLGKSSEAEQTWLDALRAEPKHVESTFNLGLCRWRAGRQSDEALLQQMNEVVSMHPGEMLPAYLVAQIHVERGDCASALPVLEPVSYTHLTLPTN